MRIALTIAGSDPTGGAGLQADLQVFRQLGLHGAGVVTALTVQDSSRVHQMLPVFPSVVLDQLRVLLADLKPHAVKLGMLASDDVVRSVAHGLASLPEGIPVVVDPVLQASDGSALLERRGWDALRGLLDGVALVTPNLDEAAALTGIDVSTRAGTEDAARCFAAELGAQSVLIKGGHRTGDPDDLLAFQQGGALQLRWLKGERIAGGQAHGTGCALSAAIAGNLALGLELEASVERGRSFVADGLRGAEALGEGSRFLVHA